MKKNNITITHPQVAAEWDYQRNGDLKPTDVTKGQTITVNWLCTPKRHPFPARVDHRCSMKSGCPYCVHKKLFPGETDLATIYPEIAAEWDYENNPDKPEDYLPASNKKKRWICPICHQSYPRKISERTLAKMGCRHCMNSGERSTSQQEQAFVFYFSMKTAVHNREKVYGYEVDILFDGAWLWEEYISKLVEGMFYHPRNKANEGAQWLFTQNGHSRSGLIYPDFIGKDSQNRIIADAKYKPIRNINGDDYLQILAYMLRFDAKAGYYFYPEKGGIR